MSILVIVASKNGGVTSQCLTQISNMLTVTSIRWLASGHAVECALPCPLTPEQRRWLSELLAKEKIDFFTIPAKAPRRKKLLICDMDATIVRGETLDNLAKNIGMGDKIAAITSRAMAGEIDFRHALNERVALLYGMEEDTIKEEISRLQYTAGAKELVQTMAANGAQCILVSGGFTHFTAIAAKELGFHHHHGNTLLFEKGAATGKVKLPILNRDAKKNLLNEYAKRYNVPHEEILAVGDGANDVDMLQTAGLGVGFHPKEFLYKRVTNSILYGDLTALLYLQGFSQKEIIADTEQPEHVNIE